MGDNFSRTKNNWTFLPGPLCLGLGLALCFAGSAAYGAGSASVADPSASSSSHVSRQALVGLARQFVDKIGSGMHKADIAMGLAPEKANAAGADIAVPDGTELLFQIKIDHRALQGDMLALKDQGRLFVSLRDFFAVLGFPIRIDPEAGRAEGWFIRENRSFMLDMKAGTVNAAGKAFSVSPETVREEDGEFLVSLDTLGLWFDMTFEPDLARQSLTLKSAVPLPLQERDIRHKRKLPGNPDSRPAQLPRQETPRLVADAPFVDLAVTGTQRRTRQGEPATQSLNYSLLSSGDVLGMTGKSFVSGDLRKGPTNVRASLGRVSEDPDLLGPAKARQFALGDVQTASLPLVSGAGQEQGVFLTNRKKDQSVTFSSTEISGDAQPDWDIELYRDNQLVGFQTADESGRYSFPDVRLFSGSNDFRLVFYGPQGEIREEKKSIPVDLNALSSGSGFYDVSLTRNEKTSYQKFSDKTDPDIGTPHFAANYEKALNDTLVASGGVRLRQEEGHQKEYAVTGLSALLQDTFVNANVAYDFDNEIAAELTGRRNFGKHRLSAQGQINTDGFSPDSETDDPSVLSTKSDLSGPLFHFKHNYFGYALEAGYGALASGTSETQFSGNVNVSSGPWRLNNTLAYKKKNGKDDLPEITDHANLLALMGKDRYRLEAKYEIKPDPGMQSLMASWLRKYSKTLSSEIEVEHQLADPVTQFDARLSWSHKNFTIGPDIQYDTDGKLSTSVSMRMGLARDPQTGDLYSSGRALTSYGGLSAHVFIDNDGDGAFGPEDEPAEGVKVVALQPHRSELTGADGMALLTDLPEARPTDIVIDSETFPDPYLISGASGFSILPRPGRVAEGLFPLHHSGEIDGTVTLIWPNSPHKNQAAAGLRLYLYDTSGRKVMFTKAAYDGFYLFSLVPPGDYFLLPDGDDLRLLGGESPMPRKVRIGYDGTILSGIDFTLPGGQNPVTIAVADDFSKFLEAHAGDLAPGVEPPSVFLNLGEYQSRLMMALVWYRLKMRYGALVAGGVPLTLPSRTLPDENGKYVLRLRPKTLDLVALQRQCRAIAARGIGCGIEILPAGLSHEARAGGEKSPG